jgi:hypothetical protein
LNEAANNYLTSVQELQRDKEIAACKSLGCVAGVKLKYGGIDAMQDAGLLIGVGGGMGYQGFEQAAAVVDMVKNLPQTLTALSAIVGDPEFRAKVGTEIADDYKQRIEMQIRAYNDGGWDGSITAGVEAGRLAVDIVAAGAVAMGASKVVVKVASAGGVAIANATTTIAVRTAAAFESLDAASQARWMSQTTSWRAATTELADMELQAGSRAHPLLRHGDQVELAQLQQRALTGITPDGVAGRAVDSTRWLNNEDMLTAM